MTLAAGGWQHAIHHLCHICMAGIQSATSPHTHQTILVLDKRTKCMWLEKLTWSWVAHNHRVHVRQAGARIICVWLLHGRKENVSTRVSPVEFVCNECTLAT